MANRRRRRRRQRITSGSKSERFAVDDRTGKRRRLRPRTHTGAVMNAELEPSPMIPARDLTWVDEDECSVCGEQYRATDLGVTWDQGEALIRQTNTRGQVAGSSGGYRSRGPVLWAMRVEKLTRWFDRHIGCGDFDGLGYPPSVVWACRFGDDCSAVEALEACAAAGLPAPIDLDDELIPF